MIQSQTGPDTIARVTALNEATSIIALLTAPFLGALVIAQWSVGAAFVLGGFLLVGVAGIAARLHRRLA